MRVRAQAPRNRSLRYSSSVAFRRLSPPTQGGGGHVARREDIVLRVPVSRGGGGERELCVSEIWPTDRFRATRADRLTPSFAYVHPYQPVFLTLSLFLYLSFSLSFFSSSFALTRCASSSKTFSLRRVWSGPRVFLAQDQARVSSTCTRNAKLVAFLLDTGRRGGCILALCARIHCSRRLILAGPSIPANSFTGYTMPLNLRDRREKEKEEERLFLDGDSIRTNASRYFSQRLAADSKSLYLMESRWG